MRRSWGTALISVNLVVLLALVFLYPELMVSPGPLQPSHARLARECFACHAPLRGVASLRCVTCHAPADIGRRTTTGQTSGPGRVKVAFHQELLVQDCMACHSDHRGPRLTQREGKPFAHELLRAAVRGQCGSCHQAPADALHRSITGECQRCHAPYRWRPAAFDHSKSFVLTGEHDAACVTCHADNDYSRYTCYGCHEHQPDRMIAKHLKKGISDITRCAACHRSASEHGEGDDG